MPLLQKMFNNTAVVCLLENWNHDISMNHKNLEQELLLQDPYDSVWLTVIGILSYLIDLVTSAIMLAFINYEKDHGNFRTVINQLLSNLYAMVSYNSTPSPCIKRFPLTQISPYADFSLCTRKWENSA
jgi:hypothetical protein